jgi:hypothetical protein
MIKLLTFKAKRRRQVIQKLRHQLCWHVFSPVRHKLRPSFQEALQISFLETDNFSSVIRLMDVLELLVDNSNEHIRKDEIGNHNEYDPKYIIDYAL